MIRCSISNKVIEEGDRVHVVVLHKNIERLNEHTSINFENDYDYHPVSLPLSGEFRTADNIVIDTATSIARETFLATFPTYSMKHIKTGHEKRMINMGLRAEGFSMRSFVNEVARGEHDNFILQFISSEVYNEIVSQNTEYFRHSEETDLLRGELYDFIENEVIPNAIKNYQLDVIVDKRINGRLGLSDTVEKSIFHTVEDMPQFDVFVRSVFGASLSQEYIIIPLLLNLIERESDYFVPYFESDALVRTMKEMGISYGKPTFVKKSYNYDLECRIRKIALGGEFAFG